MKIMRITPVFLILPLIYGCASWGTFNPATGRSEFIVVPTASEVDMGLDMHSQIAAQYKMVTGTPQAGRVQNIGRKLARVSDRQDYEYHFYLVDKNELNAFTVPGGRVYMFSGLADKLSSDDEIAGVLAHEIGHCAARHTIKKFQAAVAYDVIGGIVMSTLGMEEQVQRIVTLSTDSVMTLVFSSYSRKDEFEADRLALKYMAAAGYDPQGFVRTLELIEKESKGGRIPLFLRTHPYVSDRIEAVRAQTGALKSGGRDY